MNQSMIIPSTTMKLHYEATLINTSKLSDLGYHVVEVFEYDFRHQMIQNPEIATYTESYPLLSLVHLNTRDTSFTVVEPVLLNYIIKSNQEKI